MSITGAGDASVPRGANVVTDNQKLRELIEPIVLEIRRRHPNVTEQETMSLGRNHTHFY